MPSNADNDLDHAHFTVFEEYPAQPGDFVVRKENGILKQWGNVRSYYFNWMCLQYPELTLTQLAEKLGVSLPTLKKEVC